MTQKTLLLAALTGLLLNSMASANHQQLDWEILQKNPQQQAASQAVTLPANRWLRLHDQQKPICSQRLRLEVSNGSGLYVVTRLQKSPDRQSLLLPPADHPRILQLHWQKADCDAPSGAFYLLRSRAQSHYNPPNNGAAETLSPGQTLVVESDPQQALQLRARLRYADDAPRAVQQQSLDIRQDNGPWRPVQLESSPDYRHPQVVDGCAIIASQAEPIVLPAGQQASRIEIRSPQPLLIEALRPNDNWLFPGLNAPAWLSHAALSANSSPRDNRQRDATLSAATQLAQTDTQRSAEILSRHSFWRALQADGPTGHYRPILLPRASGPAMPLAIPRQALGSLQRRIEHVWFATPRHGRLDFALPPRDAPTTLRLLLDAELTDPILITYVDDRGHRQQLVMRPDATRVDRLHPPPQAAAVALARDAGPPPLALPLRLPASADLPLPSNVQRFTLLVPEELSPRLQLAAQIRSSSPFRLPAADTLAASHREAVHLRRLLDPNQQSWVVALQRLADRPAAEAALTRWQQSLQPGFIERRRDADGRQYWQLYAGGYATRRQAAKHGKAQRLSTPLQQRGNQSPLANHWLPMLRLLEDRIRLWRAGTAPDASAPNAPVMQLASELQAAGSNHSAELLLRGAAIYHQKAGQRQAASEALIERYARNSEDLLLQGLLADRWVRDGDADSLRRLISAFARSGADRIVLNLGLLLSPCEQPLSQLLGAAWRLEEWALFDKLLQRLSSAEQPLWTGLRALRQGDIETALALWETGNVSQWLDIYAGLQDLPARLRSRNADIRRQALAQWSSLPARLPGPRHWRAAPEALRDSAGAATLYVPSRDLLLPQSRATAAQPLRLKITGPLRLRLLARRELSSEARLDDWLHIKVDGDERRLPMTGLRPALGLELVGSKNAVSQAITAVIPLGYGEHEILVHAAAGPALLAVSRETAALDPEWLPAPNTLLFAAAQQQRLPGLQRIGNLQAELLPSCAQAVTPSSQQSCQSEAAYLPPPQYWRQEPVRLSGNINKHTLRGQRAALIRLLANQERAGLDDETLWRRADALWQDRIGLPEAGDWLGRLRDQASGWQRIRNVSSSAGQRELAALRPTDSQLSANERRVAGSAPLRLQFYQNQPRRLRLRLRALQLPWRAPLPLRVEITEPDGQSQHTTLHGRASNRIGLQLPAGDAAIELRLPRPWAGQALAVAVDEFRDGFWAGLPLQQDGRWELATAAEPLILDLIGPALLRIDEWRDGELLQHEHRIDDGYQQLRLIPKTGHSESVLRVYQRVPQDREPAPIPASELSLARAGEAPTLAPASANHALPGGAFDAASQRRGTPGIWGRIARRNRGSLEDASGDFNRREQFLELGMQYRRHENLSTQRRWQHSRVLARLHDGDGGPVLGISHLRRWRNNGSVWDTWLNGDGYVQKLGDDSDHSKALIGNLSLGTTHRWQSGRHANSLSASAFGRYLPERQRGDTAVDRDVFSQYKADHRHGLRLRNRYRYQPWQDTQWTFSANAFSNEDLSPDQLGIGIGWLQLLGSSQLDLRLRHRQFLSDDERSTSSNEQRADLRYQLDLWGDARRRWWLRIDAGAANDGELDAMLWLGLDSSRGRYYRDFAPGQVQFSALREHRLREQQAEEGQAW